MQIAEDAQVERALRPAGNPQNRLSGCPLDSSVLDARSRSLAEHPGQEQCGGKIRRRMLTDKLFFKRCAIECRSPSAGRCRQNLTHSQSIIAVNHDHFTARDQLAVQRQIQGLLHLPVECNHAART
jgi:hypothetical protein